MFTKEQYEVWLEKRNYDIEINKQMIEYFPFLLPRNRFSGKVSSDYDYLYNEISSLPYGWLKAFGYELLCELREELVKDNSLEFYRICQIKEKYGSLIWTDFWNTKNGYNILKKYRELSTTVCQCCGKPATHMTSQWIGYFVLNVGKDLAQNLFQKISRKIHDNLIKIYRREII